MKLIIRNLRNIIFNPYILSRIIIAYKKIIGNQLDIAWGLYSEHTIKNLGENSRFWGRSTIMNGEKLKIGKNVRIGRSGFFFCMGGIEIGDGTVISRNVLIYSANHDVEGDAVPYDNNYVCKKVTIGKCVWIGMNVMITPGVSIGDGAVIGMGAIVSKNVLPGEFVVSASQRVIRNRDMKDFYEKSNQIKIFAKKWPDN